MNKKDIMNMIESTGLEYKLGKLDVDIEVELFLNNAYMDYIDKKYEDKLRDLEMIAEVRIRMTKLLILINKVNDIEQQAIKINNHDLMWSCEGRKARMTNQMELLRDKYDL